MEYLFDDFMISMERASNTFDLEIGLSECFITESFEEMKDKVKHIVGKIVDVYKKFTLTVSSLFNAIVEKAKIKIKLAKIKSLLKNNPEIASRKITIIKFDERNVNECLLGIRNILIKSSSMYNDKDALKKIEMMESKLSHCCKKEEMTLTDAVGYVERIIPSINEIFKNSIGSVEKISNSDTTNLVSVTSRISKLYKNLIGKVTTDTVNNVINLYQITSSEIYALLDKANEDCKVVAGYKFRLTGKKPSFYIEYDNGKKIPVYCLRRDKFGSHAVTTTRSYKDDPVILITPDFFKFSKDVQSTILAHEMGHIVSGHLSAAKQRDNKKDLDLYKDAEKAFDNNTRIQEILNRFYPNSDVYGRVKNESLLYIAQELEADRFAIDIGGSKKALEKILLGDPDFYVNDLSYEIQKTRFNAI